MKFVCESPEHHLLRYIENIKARPQGWVAIGVYYSEKVDHTELVSRPGEIKKFYKQITDESFKAAQIAAQLFDGVENCVVYQFSDGDVLILGRPSSPKEQQLFVRAFKQLDELDDTIRCSHKPLSGDMYNIQKMVDGRMLSARRVEAYLAMSDLNKCGTIPIRRKKREESLVMVVEDDQFTGTYATNIINKETESILVKNGEEAIIQYIEHAPDIVFLDIHLPGLCGHKTLDAIMHIDPDAYVIMLSVDAVKNSIVDAYKRGAAGFLKKPFSKERLLFNVGRSPFIRKPIFVDQETGLGGEAIDHTVIN